MNAVTRAYDLGAPLARLADQVQPLLLLALRLYIAWVFMKAGDVNGSPALASPASGDRTSTTSVASALYSSGSRKLVTSAPATTMKKVSSMTRMRALKIKSSCSRVMGLVLLVEIRKSFA